MQRCESPISNKKGDQQRVFADVLHPLIVVLVPVVIVCLFVFVLHHFVFFYVSLSPYSFIVGCLQKCPLMGSLSRATRSVIHPQLQC